jgi:ribosomal protein S18 acetylase RimI-like enzyme
MMNKKEELLHSITKQQLQDVGKILAGSFADDPFWNKMLIDLDEVQKALFFQCSIQYCMRYGKAYAASEVLKGIAGWVDSSKAKITVVRSILSGSFFTMMHMGRSSMTKMKQLMAMMEKLEKEKDKQMNKKDYIYFMIIGVQKRFQGKGYGGKLISKIINESETKKKSIYLETTTENNVRLYEKYGFTVKTIIDFPEYQLRQWGMERTIK